MGIHESGQRDQKRGQVQLLSHQGRSSKIKGKSLNLQAKRFKAQGKA
jgi:hypothetical protein